MSIPWRVLYSYIRDIMFVEIRPSFTSQRKDLVFQPSPERFQLSMDEEESGNQDWPFWLQYKGGEVAPGSKLWCGKTSQT